jgi:hypothetical protein
MTAFTDGIQISPLTVRVAACLVGTAVIGVLALQYSDLVRYIKSEMM